MKKIMMSILTAIVTVMAIGSVSVNAQAETEATCVADVVAFCKECRPDETLTFRPFDNCVITYSWVYTDAQTVEAWMLQLTGAQKAELDEALAEKGYTTDDLIGWQLEESCCKWQTLGL